MYAGGLEIDRSDENGTCHLKLMGELDLATAPDLVAALGSGDYDHLIVDTTDLQFIDSTGLGALIDARERMGSDRFRLIAGNPSRRVIQITGLEEFFSLV